MTLPRSSLRIVPPDDGDEFAMSDAEYRQLEEEAPHATLPEALDLARRQTLRARELLSRDPSGFAGFRRIPKLHDLVGPFAPEDLILCGGRQGNGKSLLLQNLADDLIEQEIPTHYIGLEQSPEALRTKHACLRAGYHPRLMLKPSAADLQSAEYPVMRQAVMEQLAWLESPEIAALLTFCPVERVNRHELAKWTSGAVVKYGAQCVIVDHIDHMDHGIGQNSVHELTETVHLSKMLARRHKIPMIVASQIKRPGDRLEVYAPPAAEDFAGASAKERTADVMFGVWRPLRTDLPLKALREMLKLAKMGGESGDAVYQENVMGVRVVKDRLGDVPGKQVMLTVKRGRLLPYEPPQTYRLRETYGGHA